MIGECSKIIVKEGNYLTIRNYAHPKSSTEGGIFLVATFYKGMQHVLTPGIFYKGENMLPL